MPRPGRPRRDSRLAVAGVGVHGRSIFRVCQLVQVRALVCNAVPSGFPGSARRSGWFGRHGMHVRGKDLMSVGNIASMELRAAIGRAGGRAPHAPPTGYRTEERDT